MSELQAVKSFLDTRAYEEKKCGCLNLEKGRYPFVTLSREAGAGGRSLAEALLQQMEEMDNELLKGWKIFDRELCQKVVEEPGLNVCLQKVFRHEYHSQIEDMIEEIVMGFTAQDVVARKIFQCIRSLATVGKVILVGRAGSFLTRDLPLGVHVRLVAPREKRMEAIGKNFSLNAKKAAEFLKEQDKSRAALVKRFFNQKIENPQYYDMIINTARISRAEVAELIIHLALKRYSLEK